MNLLLKYLTALSILIPVFSYAADNRDRIAHDFVFNDIDNNPLPLSNFSGKVVLVVNTASRGGVTKQYQGMQTLWEKYRNRGLVVLGVPSNDFGGQEPGNSEQIKKFCSVNFNVDFPLTEKVKVVGQSAHPFYAWALSELGSIAKPRWNFHKYLISTEGKLVEWFAVTTSPTSQKVINAIEKHLPKS